MSKSRRQPVERYHDRVAHRYDQIYDDVYWQWHDALTWDYLKPHLPRNLESPVIDLGCGTGKWALKLLQSGYRVTCLDISREMLDQAHDKIEAAGKSAKAGYIQADLIDLSSVPPASFALATAFGDPIGCTSSPVRALKQIHQILQPNGILIATFDNRLAAIDHYLERGQPRELVRFLRDGKTNWLTKDQGERFEIHTYSPDGVRKLLEATGFTVIEMIGKTILPMRHYRQLLDTPESRREWLRIEKSLCREPDAIGRASHIQVTCKTIQ